MTCPECKRAIRLNSRTFLHFKGVQVAVVACKDHAREMINLLSPPKEPVLYAPNSEETVTTTADHFSD